MSTPILQAENLTKIYRSADKELIVLDNVSFRVDQGNSLAIIGPSGSGKTTLLGLCAGLDTATSGVVSLMGFKLNAMSEDDRAYVRNQYVGFVFQNFQLLSTLTALENVMVPLELRGERNVGQKAKDLLDRVGLVRPPAPLSLATFRWRTTTGSHGPCLYHRSKDSFRRRTHRKPRRRKCTHITDLLFGMNTEKGTTLVLVTHNFELAQRTQRILRMRGGKLVEEYQVPSFKVQV